MDGPSLKLNNITTTTIHCPRMCATVTANLIWSVAEGLSWCWRSGTGRTASTCYPTVDNAWAAATRPHRQYGGTAIRPNSDEIEAIDSSCGPAEQRQLPLTWRYGFISYPLPFLVVDSGVLSRDILKNLMTCARSSTPAASFVVLILGQCRPPINI